MRRSGVRIPLAPQTSPWCHAEPPTQRIRHTLVRINDTAHEHRAVGINDLASDLEPEAVEAGERGEVRVREGSVRHVEVFRMASVGTSIIGRPRRLPADRAAHDLYTLNCDEPVYPSSALRCDLPTL